MVISWQQNMVDTNIMRYVVIVSGHGGLNVTVDGNTTTVNVTSLQPDIEYSVSVIAIGPDEQISPPSVPIKQATTVPGTYISFFKRKAIYNIKYNFFVCTPLSPL